MKKISQIAIILFLALAGCKELGTDTGNPVSPAEDQAQDCGNKSGRCVLMPAVEIQTGKICGVLNRCSRVNQETCYNAVIDQKGLNLVLQTLPFENFSGLASAYHKKQILMNGDAYDTCLEAIIQLDCNSETVREIYSLDQPQDYSNIHKILYAHSSCLNIYSQR